MKRLFLLLLVPMIFACSEVVDLETDQIGGELVIFGRISNSQVGNYVEVTRTGENGAAPDPVLDAIVRIYNAAGEMELLQMTSPGHYELIDNQLSREFGDEFRLEVSLGGEVYSSPLQRINPIVARDSLTFQTAVETDITSTRTEIEQWVVQLFMSSEVNSSPNDFYLRWTIEEAYTHLGSALPSSHYPRWSQPQCYVIKDLAEQEIFLFEGKANEQVALGEQYLLRRRIDNTFAVKHYFNVIQSALNKETFEYWSRVESIVERAGSIFDTPPAAIPSNIRSSNPEERVLGHFEVIGVDTTRLLMTNNDIPIFFDDPCEINTPREFFQVVSVPFECVSCLVEEKILPLECVFCSLAPGFTEQRPGYF